MTWRGRVSLGDDLRRLHEYARASDMSREIGYSSVTEGEGSLDLLTESGDVRAAFGDQPDGRFGVSITHRGSLRFLPDLFTDLEDEDDSLSGRISGLGDRMVSAEGRLDGHDSTLASHNTRIGNAQSRADDAWTRAGTGISNAATAQARADSAWTRAGTGIANAATAQARADAAYALAAAGASTGDMNDLIDAINVRLGALRTWFAAAKSSDPSLPDVPGLPNIPR